ncbi:protein of unknown function [Candidatus Filomicrobium marinum]|uniref:Uncharacterized protein n=1 Tax=Candidatus Filomicrobium marinum TaxID=1608628 RepID=A0A0D6JES8_9HYPH|nr:protein of unknown function [Candidatus Filomicrobium marinum]
MARILDQLEAADSEHSRREPVATILNTKAAKLLLARFLDAAVYRVSQE